jgi:hypothetical protein
VTGLWDIVGALDMAALEQYVTLWDRLQAVQLIDAVLDRFIWTWSMNQCYSSSLSYRAIFNCQCGVLGANILDHSWTGERLLRHHMTDDG